MDYLSLMENEMFTKHTQEKHYSGHLINESEEKNRDFKEGGR